jgi:hypothetical protein
MDTLTEPNAWSAISPSFDLPRYKYLWMSLIIQMLRGSNMIGPSLSMVTYQRLSQRISPPPLGGFITLTHYQDANLHHDIITGHLVTGILHFMKKMPIDWYSKKQATIKMATYGSKFISAQTCIDQIVDLCLTLRYLGIPIRDVSYMFGDNKTIIDSTTQPHARLHKQHNALSFHHVREAIASKYVLMMHLSGKANPSDILSKDWGHQAIYLILRPILFFSRNTANLIDDNEMTFVND